ncbi:RyR domain-containing protein [Cryptosporangium minutisporangium]|uniref:RCK N-terminal domain-containing protein n=1 Tax=Cryptosporangium minutisporangium TaxID=113569 RepID=A0ABP6ST25_9ACTN
MDDGRAARSVGTTDRGAVMASEEGSSRSGVVSARGLALVVIAAGAALVLGYLGLRDHVDALNRAAGVHFGSGVADIIYYDLQLFVLDSDPVGSGSSLPWTLQVARFLAPATAAYAIVLTAQAVLARQVEQVRARRAKDHTVVVGDGPAVSELVRQVLRERRRVVIVQSEAPSALLPARNVYRVTGDPRDVPVLRRAGVPRAREVFAVGGDTATNAQVAVSVLRLMQTTPRHGAALRCQVHVDDWALLSALIAQELSAAGSAGARLELFNRHDRAARRIVAQHPPAATAGPPEIVVVGRTELAEALLSEIARWWTATRPGGASDDLPPLDVLVLVPDEDEKTTLPTHDRSAIRLAVDTVEGGIAARVNALPAVGAPPPHVYVCVDRDTDALKAGFRLLHEFRAPLQPAPRVVVAVTRWSGFGSTATAAPDQTAAILGPAGLTTINVTEEVYDIGELRLGTNERLAREIHAQYVALRQRQGDTPQTNASIRSWDELSDELKESNRAQAEDIGVKLRAIGCVMTPTTGDAEPFAFTDVEITQLAQREHTRWMKRLLDDGWTWGPRRDPDHKQHPDLVDWRNLTEESREADRNAVRTIPALLASVGLQVVRLTPVRNEDGHATPA